MGRTRSEQNKPNPMGPEFFLTDQELDFFNEVNKKIISESQKELTNTQNGKPVEA